MLTLLIRAGHAASAITPFAAPLFAPDFAAAAAATPPLFRLMFRFERRRCYAMPRAAIRYFTSAIFEYYAPYACLRRVI